MYCGRYRCVVVDRRERGGGESGCSAMVRMWDVSVGFASWGLSLHWRWEVNVWWAGTEEREKEREKRKIEERGIQHREKERDGVEIL